MEYELQDIRSFVKIAELGSFHEAADVLHLSQPALSRRIKKLEEGLGTPLLERTTRRVSLTSVGRDFLPKARRLLDDFEDSILSIRELAERQTGQVTLACIPTAAFYFLPSVIRLYTEQYPKIRIRLLDLSANAGLEAVLRAPYVYRNDATISREIFTGAAAEQSFSSRGHAVGDVEMALRYQLNQPSADRPYLIGSLRFKSRTGKDPFDVVTDCQTRCIGNTTGTGLPLDLPTGSGFYSLQPSLTWLMASDPAVFFGGIS